MGLSFWPILKETIKRRGDNFEHGDSKRKLPPLQSAAHKHGHPPLGEKRPPPRVSQLIYEEHILCFSFVHNFLVIRNFRKKRRFLLT